MVVFGVLTSRHGVSSQLWVFELGVFSSAKRGRFRSVLLDDWRFLFKLCLCKTSLDITDKFAKWINNSANNLKTEILSWNCGKTTWGQMIVSMVNFKKQTSRSFMTFCSRFRSHKSARAIERYIFLSSRVSSCIHSCME